MDTDPRALLTLLQITDTSFPTGSFAFSNGLETLVREGIVAGSDDMSAFLRNHFVPRWLSFDRWFLRTAYAAAHDIKRLAEIDRECEAHNTVETFAAASRQVGRASLISHSRMGTAGTTEYLDLVQSDGVPGHAPVVQGMIARNQDIEVSPAETGALFAAVSAALSAAVRLGTIGAIQSQQILTVLRDDLVAGLGRPVPKLPHAFSPLTDIAGMRHGTFATRLFAA